MLIPCLYLQTCMNINEIKRKRCAIFIRLDKHFWALVRSEQGSLQAPALARATRAGEADVLNCQEDLPACHPQDSGSSPPRGLKTPTTRAMCVLAFACVPNNFPRAFPPHFISTRYRLSSFVFLFLLYHFLRGHFFFFYNLKMQMGPTVVTANEALFVWCVNLH